MERNFVPIDDAYELTEGAIIKGKDQDELFQLGPYDPDKKAYDATPYEDGNNFSDFTVVITEGELMDNYLIESKKGDDEEAAEGGMLSDSV
jgi:hypothetical protein